jgi:hypothetical protein
MTSPTVNGAAKDTVSSMAGDRVEAASNAVHAGDVAAHAGRHDVGASLLPASPAGARDVRVLVDSVAVRVLHAIGVENDLIRRWTGRLGGAREEHLE